jgi:ABC-type lipoprotein export system ATPase subunit
MSYIELFNIRKTYNQEVVLDIDRLTIKLNCVVAFMGYSGSGKSTLINILSLIDIPDTLYKGGKKPKIVFFIDNKVNIEITYDDKNAIVTDLNTKKILEVLDIRSKLFGYIFQKHYLHNNFTVMQNIQIPLIVENKQIKKSKMQDILSSINLPKSSLLKYPDNLSGGQAQRASILRGMAKDSNILIADEPTSSLDINNARLVLDSIIKNIKDSIDKSILWVTHDIYLISEYADEIIVLFDGKVIEQSKNPGVGCEDKISSFLTPKDDKKIQNVSFDFEKEELGIFNKVRYVFNYAYKELFKTNIKPTSDFL